MVLLAIAIIAIVYLLRILRNYRDTLENATRYYQAVVESSPALTLVLSNCAILRYASPAFEKALDYPQRDIVGRPLTDFVHISDHSKLLEGLNDIASGTHETLECRLLCSDGSSRHFEALCQNLLDDPTVGGIVINARDITERKQAEDVLMESERRFHDALANLNLIAIQLDLKGKITFCNDFLLNLTGWTRERVIGRNWLDLFIPPEDYDEMRRLFQGIADRGALPAHHENPIITHDRERRLVTWNNTPLYDARGELVGISSIGEDITERRQAEEAINELNADLERRVAERTSQLQSTMQELEAFSYSVSHDLQAPLRRIHGFAEAMLEDHGHALSTQARDYLDRILTASQRMSDLMGGLLDLSRITRCELNRETVDLSALAESIASELRRMEPDREIELIITPGLAANSDSRLMGIVLGNLIENAFKFTRNCSKTRIEFGSVHGNGEQVFYVRDNGAGFDMAYAERLFRPFQRLHSSSEFPGNGVGLATVSRAIGRHGGKVWGESEPERGATLYFSLSQEGK
jgi:PAS domain S-box-containing protein